MCVQRRRRPALQLYKKDFIFAVRLLADDGDGRLSIRFLSVTLAHVILRLRVAREIIGFLSVTDTYIHTYKLFPRCDVELVASR